MLVIIGGERRMALINKVRMIGLWGDVMNEESIKVVGID